MRALASFLVALLFVFAPATIARAEDNAVTRAREAFVRGGQLVKDAQWAEALAAFEESARLKPHAVTTYNVAACERAMGRYTRAHRTFQTALTDGEKSGQLSPALVSEIREDIVAIEKLLAHVTLIVVPAAARITIDGTAPEGRELALDPGTHVFVAQLAGYTDVVRREMLAPGTTRELRFDLDSLPATLHIGSSRPRAQITVDDADVGLAPVEISRPAGRYHVVVKKPGFVTYEVDTIVRAGQRVDIAAPLREERTLLTQRWWFWTAAGVIVIGAAATTYFLARPDPERPALDGGGLGWTVRAP
jgi:hypothetical protein